jgi:hypothetical protein
MPSRFKAALALLEAGESQALIFTKVDRASRRARLGELGESHLPPFCFALCAWQ